MFDLKSNLLSSTGTVFPAQVFYRIAPIALHAPHADLPFRGSDSKSRQHSGSGQTGKGQTIHGYVTLHQSLEPTDYRVSDTNVGNSKGHRTAESSQELAQQNLGAEDYLPGGRNCQQRMANIRNNPRGDRSVSQWLHEWEQEWQRHSRGDKS